jgi:ribosomal protein S18 acetylase RimI-like enzyme
MSDELTYRKARISDLQAIIMLLLQDELGQTRELFSKEPDASYLDAFRKIDEDPNQFLMVVSLGQEVVGTCHLTLIPSLTYKGSSRLQIEAVRVSNARRGNNIGTWMMRAAINYGKSKGASIVQLSTDKKRPLAKQFYESLGFKATHEGMKYQLKNDL